MSSIIERVAEAESRAQAIRKQARDAVRETQAAATSKTRLEAFEAMEKSRARIKKETELAHKKGEELAESIKKKRMQETDAVYRRSSANYDKAIGVILKHAISNK